MFSKQICNNSDFLLYDFSNNANFHWTVIMSFTVSPFKNKSSNCWAFWLGCEDPRELHYQLTEEGSNFCLSLNWNM